MKRIFAHIGFSSALTLFVLNLVSAEYVSYIAAGLTALFAVTLVIKEFRQAVAVPLCFGTALFACLLFIAVYDKFVVPVQSLDGRTLNAVIYLTDFPRKTEFGYTVSAKVYSLKGDFPLRFSVRLFSSKPIDIQPYVLCSSKLSFSKLGESSFSSHGGWADNIFVSANVFKLEASDKVVNPFMSRLVALRYDIVNTLCSNITGDEGAFAAAVITGNKTRLSDSVYNSFVSSGNVHIIAISALHLSVLSGVAGFVLKALRVNNKLSVILIAVLILFYCSLAGFPVSAVRAGIMMLVILAGEFLSVRSDRLNSLGFATFIIFLNPFAASDAGAVLSILSALALTTAMPYFSKELKEFETYIKRFESPLADLSGKFMIRILSGVFVSVALIVYTLPAMYVFFGVFSVVAVVSNIFVVPLGSLSTMLSPVVYLANKADFMSKPLNSLDFALNKLILDLVTFFGSFRYSLINAGVEVGVICAFVLFVLSMYFLIYKKN